MTPFKQKPAALPKPNANYGARTIIEGSMHLDSLIRKGLTSKFLLKNTPEHIVKRCYLPSLSLQQITEIITSLKDGKEKTK